MKKTLVTPNNIQYAVDNLIAHTKLGLDTETYGVKFDDKMFSLQIASVEEAFYFNFHNYQGEEYVWDRFELLGTLKPLFDKVNNTWFIHNAKFDLHRLCNDGAYLSGRVHCTQAIERLLYNQHMRYSLDACLRRRGREKNDEVDKYIKEHKLYTIYEVEGKKRKVKDLHYDQVPLNIMLEYGCDDASDVLFLGLAQLQDIEQEEQIYQTECDLVKTCLHMERTGVKVDRAYVQKAKEYELGCLEDAISEATELANEEFRNGPKWLRSAFDRCGQSYNINPKTGNPVFDKSALENMESPIAGVVKEIRTREKYIGTYYSSFLHYSDSKGIIHANIRQSGTDTGRFSYSDPNLQNVPKEEDFEKGQIQVRKCFVPREDHCFVMIDFDQQEFRLMLDYAGEHELIHNITENGLCVHQATADMVGVERKPAKTLNFGLLYGMGVEKLSKALGISSPQGKELREKYFSSLKGVQNLIKDIKNTAKGRGYIKTWAGRRLYFDKKVYDPDTGKIVDLSYKAPNHLIQGGCGDIARVAMNRLHEYLWNFKSNMLIQVHDEIVFEIHKDELHIVPHLQKIMEDVYKPKHGMKLTCGVEHSWVSWGKQDIVDGYPRIAV